MGEWLLAWWPVLSFVLTGLGAGLVGWIAWAAGKKFVTQEQWAAWQAGHGQEHDRLDDALAAGEREFTAIKKELENLPTREDLEPISQQLGGLASTLSALAEAVGGIKTTLAGVNDTIQTLLGHELAEARAIKAASVKRD